MSYADGAMTHRDHPSNPWTLRALALAHRFSHRLSHRLVLPALVLLVTAGLGACAGEPSPEEEAAQMEEIEAFLQDYLPRLEEAYASGDTSVLDGWAAAKVQATLDKRIRDLAAQGQILAPELESLVVEDVTVWNRVNAYATTVEVWNVRVLSTGTEALLREDANQPNRVQYQLKKDGDRWRVFERQLREVFE